MGPKLISQPAGQAGFTLIELLVVIAILGVLGVGAALTVGRGGPETAESSDMARFQVAYATQAALAVQGREQRGLAVKAGGLQAMRPGPQGWVAETTEQPWRGRVALSEEVILFDPQGPDIRFLPNGRSSAFTISFGAGGRCESNGWTGLTCAAR